jgi:hypothetical protein
MTLIAPLVAALALAWLALARPGARALALSAILLPVLVALAPSRLELGVTIVVEAPIVWLLAWRLGLDRWRAAVVCGFANALTQPLLFLFLRQPPSPGSTPHWALSLGAGELVVWIVEAALYLACLESLRRARSPILTALGLSLAANAASTALGLLLAI